jgi:membrane protein required for colicin V production
MGIIDIVIIIVLVIGIARGAWRGFVRQLAGILGFVAGLVAAMMLYRYVAEHYFVQFTDSMTVAQILSFILIWLIVPMLFAVVASLLTRALEAVSLGCFNRWLGAGLGALKYLLFLCVVIGVLEFVDPQSQLLPARLKKESRFYGPLKSAVDLFFPKARQATQDFIRKV